MAYKYFQATVTGVIQETEFVRRFVIQMPEESQFTFKAGQFVMFNLPIESKYTNRAYSIASPPSKVPLFEVCIVNKPGGIGTDYMWDEFRVGRKVQVSKAIGKFTLQTPIENDICFVCTGTGIAPFRSQIFDLYQNSVPHRNIYLVFGNRFESDILYRKEFEALQSELSGFHFIPVLSRENPGWNGEQGYVHAVYERLFADRRPATFYLCGWSAMLKEARERLAAMGYGTESVRFETYD
jgi:ferredoxin-NADP reductase